MKLKDFTLATLLLLSSSALGAYPARDHRRRLVMTAAPSSQPSSQPSSSVPSSQPTATRNAAEFSFPFTTGIMGERDNGNSPEFGTFGGHANAKISCVMAFPGDLLRFTTCDNYADSPYYNNQNVGKCRGACKLTLATGTTAYPTRYSNGGPSDIQRNYGRDYTFSLDPSKDLGRSFVTPPNVFTIYTTFLAPWSTGSLSNTASAQQNYTELCFTHVPGFSYEYSSCNPGSSGDSYLRLYRNGSEVAFNDDSSCLYGGLLSRISYTPSDESEYCLRAGCFSGGTCTPVIDVRKYGPINDGDSMTQNFKFPIPESEQATPIDGKRIAYELSVELFNINFQSSSEVAHIYVGGEHLGTCDPGCANCTTWFHCGSFFISPSRWTNSDSFNGTMVQITRTPLANVGSFSTVGDDDNVFYARATMTRYIDEGHESYGFPRLPNFNFKEVYPTPVSSDSLPWVRTGGPGPSIAQGVDSSTYYIPSHVDYKNTRDAGALLADGSSSSCSSLHGGGANLVHVAGYVNNRRRLDLTITDSSEASKYCLKMGCDGSSDCEMTVAFYRNGAYESTTNYPTSMPTNPTGQPTGQPSGGPTGQPTGQPSGRPTGQPTGQPSGQPTGQPTGQPSGEPTGQPTGEPTGQPSGGPSGQPTGQPSGQPSGQPTGVPTGQPSSLPTAQPTAQPSGMPSISPTDDKFPVWAIALIVVLPLLTCFFIAGYMGIFNKNEVAPDPAQDPEDPDLTAQRADDNQNQVPDDRLTSAESSAESSASPPKAVVAATAAQKSELPSTVRQSEPTWHFQ